MHPPKVHPVSAPPSSTALLAAVFLTLGGTPGCLCPPCEAGAVAPTSNALQPAPAAPAPAASTPLAAGQRHVIWDGEEVTAGQSWASCDKEGQCKSTLMPAPGKGAGGTSGLELHGEGPGWQGGGWNWFGWYPENAGTDLTGYDDLSFSVKVTAPSKDKSPSAGGISFAFGCSKDKKNSADASLGKYAPSAADGQWHEVHIPLADFFSGKGAECDARTAWELRVSSWSGTPVTFDLVLDNIVVSKK
jgi:hypothetical protein